MTDFLELPTPNPRLTSDVHDYKESSECGYDMTWNISWVSLHVTQILQHRVTYWYKAIMVVYDLNTWAVVKLVNIHLSTYRNISCLFACDMDSATLQPIRLSTAKRSTQVDTYKLDNWRVIISSYKLHTWYKAILVMTRNMGHYVTHKHRLEHL